MGGTLTHNFLSEPEGQAKVSFLRTRTHIFIAYFYKPEAQAKVSLQA